MEMRDADSHAPVFLFDQHMATRKKHFYLNDLGTHQETSRQEFFMLPISTEVTA